MVEVLAGDQSEELLVVRPEVPLVVCLWVTHLAHRAAVRRADRAVFRAVPVVELAPVACQDVGGYQGDCRVET